MNVLVACEESQRVCTAFRERGHNAFSCDIQDCSAVQNRKKRTRLLMCSIFSDAFISPDSFCSFGNGRKSQK